MFEIPTSALSDLIGISEREIRTAHSDKLTGAAKDLLPISILPYNQIELCLEKYFFMRDIWTWIYSALPQATYQIMTILFLCCMGSVSRIFSMKPKCCVRLIARCSHAPAKGL
ncbi:MAG: hypothetical protein LIO95_06090 [Clostridiales bacterium]|nr:hypothetical protein [Clostridiales bacterium]